MAASPLEGFGNTTWVCFQRALVVRDIFTGGKRTFFSREDAQDFRARTYARNGTALPWPANPAAATILRPISVATPARPLQGQQDHLLAA